MPASAAAAGFLAGVTTLALVQHYFAHKFLLWPRPSIGDDVDLGDATYRVQAIDAPAANGCLLKLLAKILGGGGVLAQHLRRLLLNDNRLHRLRLLATKIIAAKRSSMMFYPMKQLSFEGLEEHRTLAAGAEEVRQRCGKYNGVLDYHEAFKAQRTTPLRVLETLFSVLDALPSELQPFSCMVDRDTLRAKAQQSGKRYSARKPLSVFDGVLVAFKDMVLMSGAVCTFGTHASLGEGPAVKDDVTIARLKAAGAIAVGLTVMTEHGVTPLGYSVHGQAPMSAYGDGLFSGGSSSGSAVGAALGLFPVALGFDGGGSIRIPSAMQGIVGLKSTWGRIPVDTDFCYPNVASGPMAASAADAALFYTIVGQPVENHFYQRMHGAAMLPQAHCSGFNNVEDLSDIRLGVFEEWFADCNTEILARAREALAFLLSKGAQAVPIKIPHLEILALAHGTNISVDFTVSHEHQHFEAPGTLEPASRIQLALGGSMSGTEYVSTCWIRGWAMDFFEDLFQKERLSALFTPTLPTFAPQMSEASKATGESNTTLVMELLKYIGIANFCGFPSISMPVGLSSEGLPIAVLCTANHWDEHICLRIANALDVPQFQSQPARFVDLLASE